MDLISSYHSDNDDRVFQANDAAVAIAPHVNPSKADSDKLFVSVAEKSVSINLPFDQMYAPLKGPKPPRSLRRNPGNALNGNVEASNMDEFVFEENFHTFENFGYSADPNHPQIVRIAGDKDKFEASGGATSFRDSLLKRRKYRRPERESKGDASQADGFKGPWAKFKEDQDVLEELRARQTRMKQLFEQAKNNASTTKPDDKDNESTTKSDDNGAQKNKAIVENGNENVPTSKSDDNDAQKDGTPPEYGREDSIFEYTHEKDYQGRTYMHCPKEFRNKDPQHRCYIPTKRVHTWRGHTKAVSAIRWFPGTGHVLLSASMDKTIKIWDANTHRALLRTVAGHQKGVRDITFSKDGRRFLSVGLDQWIKLWDTETGQAVGRFCSGVQSQSARFYSPNENEFLAAQSDKLVVGWDARNGEIIQKYVQHQKAVNAVVFIDNCRQFASSGDDKKIFIWEYGLPVVVNHISEPYMHSVPCLAETPDGGWFLAQSMDNAILAYSTDDQIKHRKRRYIGHTTHGYACQVDASPDMQFLVSGDSDGKAVFWDWKTKRIYKRLKAHSQVTIGAAWHPVHPSKVATCSWDATIKLWD